MVIGAELLRDDSRSQISVLFTLSRPFASRLYLQQKIRIVPKCISFHVLLYFFESYYLEIN